MESTGVAGEARQDVGMQRDPLRWPLDVADRSTVVRARALLQGALTVLGLEAEARYDAEVCAAELVANAARWGEPPVELRLGFSDGCAVVEVLDGKEALPVWPSGADDVDDLEGRGDLDKVIEGLAEFGRGLQLVRQLSGDRCGARPTDADHGAPGKAVWFAVALRPFEG